MKNLRVLIAGGGIAGLASAIALARVGHEVEVCEKRASFEETGAAIQLGPNAWHALDRLGLREAVSSRAVFPERLCIRDGQSGKLLTAMEFDENFRAKFNAPYATILRADLHFELLQEARQSPQIELTSGREVRFEDSGASYDALLAADGINSAIRTKMFPGSQARALPFTIFRALQSPHPPLLRNGPSSPAERDVSLNPSPQEKGDHRGTRWGMRSLRETNDSPSVNLWFCRNGHVVHYPTSQPGQFNLVAACAGLVDRPSETLKQLCPELASLFASIELFSTWPVQAVPSLSRWHKGKVCLLGDAAHGTVPFLAQGAAMALEDAVAIADSFQHSDTLDETFTRFENSRRRRTARLDAQSQRMTRIYHAGGPLALARNAVMQSGLISPLQFVTWIYRHRDP
jgi:salicylate hydroxylase